MKSLVVNRSSRHTYGGKLLHSQIVFKTWECSIALVSIGKPKDLDVVIYGV